MITTIILAAGKMTPINWIRSIFATVLLTLL
jgi:hypothetical protein